MIYGIVEIYVVADKEVSTAVFDYTNLNSVFPNQVNWIYNSCQNINIMIKSVGKSIFIGRVGSTVNNAATALIAGYPQVLLMNPAEPQKFTSQTICGNNTDVITTILSGDILSLLITPFNHGAIASNTGFVSFKSSPSAIGSATTIVAEDRNATIATLLIREQSGNDKFPVHLSNGAVQRDKISTIGGQQFYIFQVPAGITGGVTISLEATQGDVDLFVNLASDGFYHREQAIHGALAKWSSQRPNGIDMVDILSSDPNYIRNGGAYYITAYGYTDAEFVVRVMAGNVVSALQDGFPVTDELKPGQYRYYRYFDTHLDQATWLDLIPTGGDADIFISCKINPTGDDTGYPAKADGHFNFSSTSYLEDTLVIEPYQKRACARFRDDEQAIFYIAVYGYGQSTYTLSAMHATGQVRLTPGISYTGMVYKQLGRHFSVRVGFEAQDLTIQLMPFYGDCDLFVKLKGVADSGNYDFYSIKAGSVMDVVTIPEEKICTDCEIGISVFGYETARFSILAYFTDSTLTLTNGVPLRGSVAQDSIQYYTYTVDMDGTSSAVLTLTLFNSQTPSLYMSNVVERPNATSPNTLRRLSDSNDGTVPTLTLPGLRRGSNVYIGIHGTEGNSSYTVRVHSVSTNANALPPILPLIEGTPQTDSIPRTAPSAWLYYGIQSQPGHEAISVRSLNIIGNVDLYVTKCNLTTSAQCAERKLPDFEHFIANSAELDDDVLKIIRNDNSATLYIVGVYSLSYYTAFQLSFGYESSILELQAGLAVTDHVFEREYDYFAFYVDSPKKLLKFTLSPMSGDPDIFVSTKIRHPTVTNSTWRGLRYGSDVIEINTDTDSNACVHCTYYIAVFGASEATYTIMASVETTYFTLQDGVPMTGSVSQGDWNYYSFLNRYGSDRDFRAVLSSITGNADIFITLDGSLPSWYNYDYRSVRSLTDDILTIKHTDSTYAPCISDSGESRCRIFIGVQGVDTYSEYSLSLTSSIGTNLIQLGRTVTGIVGYNDYVFYRIAMSQRGNTDIYTLRISATPSSGHMAIYASCDRPMPRSNSSMWSLVPATAGNPLDISSFFIVESGCLQSSSYIYFSIYGFYSPAAFSLQAQIVNNASVGVLGIGQSISGMAESGEVRYFYIRPSNLYNDIELTLSLFYGDVDLYVSSTWDQRPRLVNSRMQSYDMKSALVGNDDVVISHRYIETHCGRQLRDCYFIIAVYAVYGSPASPVDSSYLLTARLQESIVTLMNGVPMRGSIGSGNTDYYKFTLLQKDVDVSFSVSAMYGDPDLFIGMGSIHHPRIGNATWSQMSLGADTLTLQFDDIKSHCVPVPSLGKGCDFFVGVYGWQNSSYAITVTVNDGFLSPILLMDQMPTSGHVGKGGYQYFKYFVRSTPPGPHSSIPLALQFVLTPTGGSDVDLYMTVAANDSVATEPGRTNYDFKSTSWSDVIEHIEFSATMPKYCYDCVIYLAAYGYAEGSFTLQASSTGVLSLQDNVAVAGVISKNSFNYYSYFNADPYAEMTIMLTSISGDADLYITRRRNSDTKFNMPSTSNFIWRSMFYGSDSVTIAYDDQNFCTDCEFIIGVTGYTNATFTLTTRSKTASIIRLRPSRPQNAALEVGSRMYFSSEIPTTTSDVMISATSVSTGYVDIYVRLTNASALATGRPVLPDPAVPSSFTYSTRWSEDNHVFIPGPRNEQNAVAIITVVALNNVRFVVMAATSDHPAMLQLGIPQSHFVAQGGNAVFQLYPSPYDDLRITVTARTGDPDLFISSSDIMPHCHVGDSPWEVSCANYTWSSGMYSTDQIIISRDFPCSKILPSTVIAASCNPDTAFAPGAHSPVYVTVYGYMASKFTIMGASVGATNQLLPGQPQLSSTSPGFICSDRSATTGACSSRSKVYRKVQVSYFAFQVSSQLDPSAATSHLDVINDVILTINPSCNHTGNATVLPMIHGGQFQGQDTQGNELCEPGCACSPLRVYINSCPISRCSELDRKPSELTGQSMLSLSVNPAKGSTVFITPADPVTKSAHCDPTKNGEGCLYFVSVTHDQVDDSAIFTVTARTPSDISLIPCDAREYPDRIRIQTTDYIAPSWGNTNSGGFGPRHQQRFYELCSQSNPKMLSYQQEKRALAAANAAVAASDTLIVEAEQCHGHTSFYACADDSKCAEILPSLKSWGYFADRTRSCVHSFDKYGRDICQGASPGSNLITLRLPQIEGNYFLMANGTGRFNFQVRSTSHGMDLAPFLMFSGIQEYSAGGIDVQAVTGNSMTLRWRQARVLLPGIADAIAADYMKYKVYIFDDNQADRRIRKEEIVQQSTCGLEYLSTVLPVEAVTIVPNAPVAAADRGNVFMTYTVRGLKPSTAYRMSVVATCDSFCLSQLTKSNYSPRLRLSCFGGNNECKAQSLAYIAITMTTAATPDSDDTHGKDTHGGGFGSKVAVIVGTIFLVLLVVGIVLAGAYWWKSHRILSGVDVDDTSDGSSSAFGAASSVLANAFSQAADFTVSTCRSIWPGGHGHDGHSALPASSSHSLGSADEGWGPAATEVRSNDGSNRGSGYLAPSSVSIGLQAIGSTVNKSWSAATSSVGGALRSATGVGAGKSGGFRRVNNDDPAGMEGETYLPLQVLGKSNHNAVSAASPYTPPSTANPMQPQQFTLDGNDDDEEVHMSL
jgi:hypothetical protein